MPWLSIVIFLPLVGIPVLLLWRGMTDAQARWLTLAVMVADFVVALGALEAFDPGRSGYQLVEQVDWVPSVGLSYLVGVDGFSIWLVVLTAFMSPVALVATWEIRHRVRLFMALSLVLETVVLGSFCALDLLVFFAFFEALLVPMMRNIGIRPPSKNR